METLIHLLGLALQVYFWLVVLKYLIPMVGIVKSNQLVDFIDKVTDPYLALVKKYLPEKLSKMLPMFALIIIYWAIQFFPTFISATITAPFAPADSPSYLAQVFGALFLSIVSLLRIVVWSLMVASLVQFVSDMLKIDNAFTQSVKSLMEPMLAPLKKFLPVTKIDISPVVLFILLFLVQSLLTGR